MRELYSIQSYPLIRCCKPVDHDPLSVQPVVVCRNSSFYVFCEGVIDLVYVMISDMTMFYQGL